MLKYLENFGLQKLENEKRIFWKQNKEKNCKLCVFLMFTREKVRDNNFEQTCQTEFQFVQKRKNFLKKCQVLEPKNFCCDLFCLFYFFGLSLFFPPSLQYFMNSREGEKGREREREKKNNVVVTLFMKSFRPGVKLLKDLEI